MDWCSRSCEIKVSRSTCQGSADSVVCKKRRRSEADILSCNMSRVLVLARQKARKSRLNRLGYKFPNLSLV
jgi:hypothetical protein